MSQKLAAGSSRFMLPSDEVTPEHVWLNRRRFIQALGVAGIGLGLSGGRALAGPGFTLEDTLKDLAPLQSQRDARFSLDRPLTARRVAASFNNFYEFTPTKNVWPRVERFQTKPWQVEITGLVQNPVIYDVKELIAGQKLEERLYRFRCVEAWAMAVPWIGFPLHRLLKQAQPLPQARYVRFLSFLKRDQAPSQNDSDTYQLWPYFEGLTLPEAMNELALVTVGIYGHELPKQHGAPIRVILPWKYGFKGPKSITRIELVAQQPRTFWNTLGPDEYDFWSNVNPDKPHPRWSQRYERLLGTGERRATQLYNGYGPYVAHLYAGLKESDPRYGFGKG